MNPDVPQALPRCCNTALVGCHRVATGHARPPQPYVAIRVGKQRRGYTSIGERNFSPKWEERFRIPVANSPRDIEFQIKVRQFKLISTQHQAAASSSCPRGTTSLPVNANMAESIPTSSPFPQDGDAFGSPHLGSAVLEAHQLMDENHFDGWLKVRGRTGRQQNLGKSRLRVTVDFIPVQQVGPAPGFAAVEPGVPQHKRLHAAPSGVLQ